MVAEGGAMMKPACAFEFLNHWSISLTFKTITQLGATLKEPSSADTICSLSNWTHGNWCGMKVAGAAHPTRASAETALTAGKTCK
jgi:hypothetical protein